MSLLVGHLPVSLDRHSLDDLGSPRAQGTRKPTPAASARPADPPRAFKHPEGNAGDKASLTARLASMSLEGKPSRSAKLYVSGVFKGATRPFGDGFDERKMHALFSSSRDAAALEKQVGKMGFRYAGDTQSRSKANTQYTSKTIKINASLSCEQAALSFAYELENARQHNGGKLDPIQRLLNSARTGEEYAEGVLRMESRSVLKRSQIALDIGLAHLVVNPKYNEVARNGRLSREEKLDAIFSEMKANGKVNKGQDSAFDHYVKQYHRLKG